MISLTLDDDVKGGIRKDIHFCAGGEGGKDTCQVILFKNISLVIITR
jgi:hypothetical protein